MKKSAPNFFSSIKKGEAGCDSLDYATDRDDVEEKVKKFYEKNKGKK